MLSALLLAAQTAAAPPPARTERIRDAWGRPVAAFAVLERNVEKARHQLLLFRRSGKDDLVLCLTRLEGKEPSLQLWTGRGAALRIERLADGRYAVTDGARNVRWYGEDAATRTYRCAVRAAVDARDPNLAAAVEDYLAMREAIPDAGAAELDRPLTVMKRSGPAPSRLARTPFAEDDPEGDALRREAEAALAVAIRAR